MHLKYRRLLYIIFVVFFIIAAAWLLLYTQGYTYNFKKNHLEQTGSLKITTYPAGATITLNDQPVGHLSPYIIKKLLPDNYLTTIKLPGHQLWSKNINVTAGKLTNLSNIILWPDEQLSQIINKQPTNITAIANDKTMLVYQINGGLESGLWILNLASGQTSLLERTAQDPLNFIEWSPNNNRLLLQQKKSNDWYIYNLNDNSTTPLPVLDNLNTRLAHWSADDNNTIYFATDQEIYQLNTETGKTKLLLRLKVNDFRHHQGLIYTLNQDGAGTILKVINLKNLQAIPSYDNLPPSTNFSFLPRHNNWLPLLDKDKHQLYLLSSSLTSLKYIINLPEVINVDWLPNSQLLLLSNNYETWSYNTETAEKKLLYRISQPLQFARWYNNDYVILIADQIYALETDTTAQQKWPLLKNDKTIQEVITDPTGYYLTIITSDQIQRLMIREPQPGLLPIN